MAGNGLFVTVDQWRGSVAGFSGAAALEDA
jgi:hypothetical protein